MTDKELAQKLRRLAVDLDLSGRTDDWHVVANAATRLEELEALRTYTDLTERVLFWQQWTMDWRTTSAIINRQIEIGTVESLRKALDLYKQTREAYTTELRALLEKDPD